MVEFGWGLIAGDIFGVTGIRYDKVETLIGTVGESEVIFEVCRETNFIVDDVAVGCLVVVRARLVFVVVVVVDDDVFVVVSDVVVFRVALVVPPEFAVMPRFRRIGP